MSQKLLYVCEICRREFTDVNGVIGFEFDGAGSLKKLVGKQPGDVHRHFCIECAGLVRAMLNQRNDVP